MQVNTCNLSVCTAKIFTLALQLFIGSSCVKALLSWLVYFFNQGGLKDTIIFVKFAVLIFRLYSVNFACRKLFVRSMILNNARRYVSWSSVLKITQRGTETVNLHCE